FQAEDGIRDKLVTGVQTCALPIYAGSTRYLILPFLVALTFTRLIAPPSAIRASTESAISGSSVPFRMVSTLRAPESTSVQRARRSEERRVGKEWRARWAP